MKIIVTGASGFVGSLIVPELNKKDIKMLLVGRCKNKLKRVFSEYNICDYDELKKFAKNYDCIIHLATFNNARKNNILKAKKENLEIFKKVFEIAKLHDLFIFNFSSTHSLDLTYKTDYAESKREIEKFINNTNYYGIETLYMPFIYGKKLSGKLKILNIFPNFISRIIFYLFSALKPTVNIQTIINYLLKSNREVKIKKLNIISENIIKNFIFLFLKSFGFIFFFYSFLILWWLFISIWLFVKLETPGPGIIFQKRVGKHGKIFNCLKFRTMKSGVKQAPTHQMSLNDLTFFGSFLRKTKLDELPQIFNIILNEMSLVGPRPCLEIQNELIAKRKEFNILDIKPGVTGFAQINKVDMSDIYEITKFDYIYLKTQSILNDIKIIIKTVFGAGNIDNIKS